MNTIVLLIVIFLSGLLVVKVLTHHYNYDFNWLCQNSKDKVEIGNGQIIGDRRKQEDSFSTIKRDEKVLALLADGMGGLFSGKKASKIATKTYIESFTRKYNFNCYNKFLLNTAHQVNEKILDKIEDKRIGTTLVAVFLTGEECHWLSIGDSNLFYFKDGVIEAVNKKHVYKNQLRQEFRAGKITREELLNHPRRDMLTSYLGDPNFHKIDYSQYPLEFKPGDKLLLCSDGVTDVLNRRELENILEKNLHPMETSRLILEAVKEKQITNQDNATVVILHRNKQDGLESLFQVPSFLTSFFSNGLFKSHD